MTLIWFPVCFLLSTFISHLVRGVIFFPLFLLHLLHLCDKVSYVCLSFDEWVLKVFCLKVKQQSCLKVSCLKYHFGILLFSLNLALNELRKGLTIYVNGRLTFYLPFLNLSCKNPSLQEGKKKKISVYAYEICMQSRIYMFRKYICMTESMSLLGSITRKMKGEMSIR